MLKLFPKLPKYLFNTQKTEVNFNTSTIDGDKERERENILSCGTKTYIKLIASYIKSLIKKEEKRKEHITVCAINYIASYCLLKVYQYKK